ncbi:MAG: HEAT repeat domain-containing protein [Phycisphaerae bacterium]
MWTSTALAAGRTSAAPTSTSPATMPLELTPSELVVRIAGQSDPQARLDAAVLLLGSPTRESVRALLAILDSKNNDPAKLAICQAIIQTQTDDPAFIPSLMALLDHKEAAIRESAAAALAGFHDPLVTARLKDLERQLLEKRFLALCKLYYGALPTDADRASLLQRWLRSAGLPQERVAALEIVHDQMSAGTRPAPDVLLQIRQMIGDRDERVRQRVVIVLRDFRQVEDAPLVRKMLENERSPMVREEIYKALGYLGDAGSVPACVAGLNDPVETVAGQAAAALGRLAAKGQPVPDVNLDSVAAALLGRVEKVIENPVLREQVIGAMAQVADPRFLPVLRRYASSDEPMPAIRQAALLGIGQAGDGTQADVVIERLKSDPDSGVREFAAEALGKLGSKPEHLELLRERLDPKVEASPAVQARAWEAYKQLFTRVLSADDRDAVLKTWAKTDPVAAGRRVELLAALEKQIGKTEADPQRLARLREELGDAYLSVGRAGDAAGAFAGALELLLASDAQAAQRVAEKLMEAHLRTPAVEKAVALIQEMKNTALRAALIGRLLEFIRQSGNGNPAAAIGLLNRVDQLVPDRFGTAWASQFEELRKALPATRPAASRANVGSG